MKHNFKLLLVALMLLCSTVATAHDFEVDGIYYNITSNKTVEVTYRGGSCNQYSNEYTGSVVIPSSVTYNGTTYSVTTIGSEAFYYCSGLTSVTIPNSVTSIGEEAFLGCSGLTSVTIGSGVTSIGSSAFYNCRGLKTVINYSFLNIVASSAENGYVAYYADRVIDLQNGSIEGDFVFAVKDGVNTLTGYLGSATEITLPYSYKGENYVIGASAFIKNTSITSVTIPAGVTSIGGWAFASCTGITSITIGSGVTSIGGWAFEGCTGLTNVTIPNSVTSIGGSAFEGCTSLTNVTIPNSVTSIGGSAFSGCTGLTNVTIPNSVTSIGGSAFRGCTSLTSVTIGSGVTSIGKYAFLGCSGLTSVTIPNSVTSIGEDAFSGCSGLTSVTIPASVTSIGSSAFDGCNNLTAVHISDLAAWCNISFSDTNSNPLYYAKNLYLNGEIVADLVIPDGVTEIKNYTFYNCEGLTSVTIPDGVKSIGSSAFDGCNSLTAVHISDLAAWCNISFSDTNSNPLYYAKNLYLNGEEVTNLVIPDGVTEIKDYAFRKCTGLTSVTIPNSVTSIGDEAFYGCENLKTVINCSSLNIVVGSTDNGYVAYYANKVIDIQNGSVEGDFVFVVKDGVNTLTEYLGSSTEITLPANYKGKNYEIGDSVFYNRDLTSVTIPASVTSIGDGAFMWCDELTSVTIPESVIGIGDGAFFNCYGLTSIIIGSGVKSIGAEAFQYCRGLTNVTIGSGVTSIGEYAFSGCTGLTSVVIPNSVTSIGSSAFDNCSGLTSVVIPNSVTSIGENAFLGCTGLTSVTIGSGVTSIGSSAFQYCRGLKTVINYSFLNIVAGSAENGYVAYYANNVINAPNGLIEGDFVFARTKVTSLLFTTADGLPGTVTGSNHIWESPVINNSTNRVRITVFATNVTDSYNEYPIVALGELEFYDGNGNKIAYSASNVTTNSLESTEGSLAGLCDGDYSTFYHSTWWNGTTPDDYVYLDIIFPQTVDALKIKMVGRNTQRCVPTGIRVILTGEDNVCSLFGYIGDDTALVLPESYKGENYVIGASTFKNNTSITSVTIPNSVTSIGEDAFSGCSGLTSVTIPASVTSIGSSAFDGCNNLTAVHISDLAAWCNISFNGLNSNPLYYAKNLYLNGEKLTDLVIPNSVTSINECVFAGCSGLTSVTIPNSVTSIGKYAFLGCSGLTSVTIPNSVTSIGDDAFSGCSGLKTVINYSSLNIVKGSFGNGCVAYYADRVANVPNAQDASIEGDFVFGVFEGVNTLAGYLGSASEITLPDNYKGENYVIGAEAFKYCRGLTNVTIPNSVTSIGSSAFQYCSGLTSVTIPDGVKSIGSSAFDGCTGLTSVTIGSGVTSIGEDAFLGCRGLTSVHISDLAAWCNISFSDTNSNPLYYAKNLYLNGEKVTDLVIPNSVTSIGSSAFDGCNSLTSVTIPASVTSIGSSAFDGCNSLTAVYISDLAAWCNISFNGLRPNPLYYAKNLYLNGEKVTDLVIPNSVTSIGRDAFLGCSGLTSVTIPNSVTSIGDDAFSGCTGITSITIGSGVTSIGGWAFEGCTGLTNVTIPDGVKSIGSYAFDGCTRLTKVTIGNGVTSIGESAFNGCNIEKLEINCDNIGSWFSGETSIKKEVIIGDKVTSIGRDAFSGCENLKTVMNCSSLNIVVGSTENGYVAYYADRVINAQDVSIEGDFVFGVIDGVNTLTEYLGSWTRITLPDSYKGENYVIGESAFRNCTGLASVTIPNSVTSIGEYAFEGCTGLTKVTIGNGVTSIGYSAFDGCTNLKTVINCSSSLNIVKGSYNYGRVAYYADKVINAQDVSIEGDFVFVVIDGVNTLIEYLGSWTRITLPDSYKGENYVIGEPAFRNCTGLTSVTIPNSVTEIKDHAFYGCTGLTSVTIGSGVTSIGDCAFSGCTGLTSVTIGSGVTSIGNSAFYGCTGLTSVTIPNSVTSIDYYAFSGCTGLTKVTIGNGLTSIGRGAFEGCTGLTSVTIGSGVTSIGNSAFEGCTGLTKVTIGNGVTSIDYYAFSGCTGLTNVTIPNSVTTIYAGAFSGCTGLTKVTIGSGVTGIGADAFYGCENLKTVMNCSSLNIVVGSTENGRVAYYADKVINAQDVSIEGDFVFVVIDGVNTLVTYIGSSSEIILPELNTGYVIGEYAFYGCTGLTSVTIGNSVTSIGDNAFLGCSGLTSVVIPKSVTRIGESAFYGCTNLKTVINCSSSLNIVKGSIYNGYVACYADRVVNVPNAQDASIEGDFVFAVKDGVNTLAGYLGSATEIALPANYKGKNYVIGEGVFNGNTNITIVSIPASVNSIGSSAFSGCSGLTSVTIGESVTSIGADAFSGCTGLTAVHISDLAAWCNISFANYNSNPLYKATNLYLSGEKVTSLDIPWGVTSIKPYVFRDFFSLTSVTIPGSVTSIGEGSFRGCIDLASVVIPNSVTCIGDDAFYDCYALASIKIGSGVTSIGDDAFYDCYALASIKIGSGVTSIGEDAFRRCTALTEIFVESLTPATINYYTFEGLYEQATLYVPVGAKTAYKAADYWKKFYNIVEMEFTGIDEVVGEVKGENLKVKDVYDLSGRKVTDPTKGIYIVNGKKVLLK